jgi:hypothetical protein
LHLMSDLIRTCTFYILRIQVSFAQILKRTTIVPNVKSIQQFSNFG